MKKMISALLLSTIMSTSLLAGIKDVYPAQVSKNSQFVKITKVSNEEIKIESCRYQVANSCRILGNRDSYSIEELKDLRNSENLEILGAAGTDVVLLAAGCMVGTYIGAAVAFNVTMSVSMPAFIISGVGAGGAIAYGVDALNPLEQSEQAKTLNSEVLNDRDVKTDDIGKFIKRLDLVLSKI